MAYPWEGSEAWDLATTQTWMDEIAREVDEDEEEEESPRDPDIDAINEARAGL